MAVGDDALAAGMSLVPNTGSPGGLVRNGAMEINRTRDYIAAALGLIPVGISGYQAAAGISSGTSDPVNADGKPNGTIYFKTL